MKHLHIILLAVSIMSSSARLGSQISDNSKSIAIAETNDIEERVPVEPLGGPDISRQLRRKRNGKKRNGGGGGGSGGGSISPDGKKNAAQKRQDQRDKRRETTNPYRTQEEEDRERERKHRHGQNRGPRADPYEPGYSDTKYAKKREERRRKRCQQQGKNCNYKALNWDCPDGDCHHKWDYDQIHEEDYGS